jgi:hypothetical protein
MSGTFFFIGLGVQGELKEHAVGETNSWLSWNVPYSGLAYELSLT